MFDPNKRSIKDYKTEFTLSKIDQSIKSITI